MKKILIILLVAFVIIQFFPIDKTNPPVNKGMDFLRIKDTPENVAKIISNSCYDCHSNETKYPLYSSIAPSSWFLKNHINDCWMKLKLHCLDVDSSRTMIFFFLSSALARQRSCL